MKQISEKKVVAALFPNRKESTATTFFVLVYGFPKKESVTYLPGQTEILVYPSLSFNVSIALVRSASSFMRSNITPR